MTTSSSSSGELNEALGRPIRILLVEDSPSDVAMTKAALQDGRIASDLFVVGDGEAAMAFVHRQGAFADAPRPDLILLDLNLPRKDGREVLVEIKEDHDLRAIPVIVLTSSAAESDIVRSYELLANAYVTKPLGLEDFLAAIREIEEFWLSLVRLPNGPA